MDLVNKDRKVNMRVKYRIYCLQFLTQNVDEIIDSELITYEEFCKRYREGKI